MLSIYNIKPQSSFAVSPRSTTRPLYFFVLVTPPQLRMGVRGSIAQRRRRGGRSVVSRCAFFRFFHFSFFSFFIVFIFHDPTAIAGGSEGFHRAAPPQRRTKCRLSLCIFFVFSIFHFSLFSFFTKIAAVVWTSNVQPFCFARHIAPCACDIERPTFTNSKRLLARVTSSLTSSLF